MARGYYYLISALPELSLNDKDLEYNMVTYRDFVGEQLHPDDRELLGILYYRFDIYNMVSVITESGRDWHPAGNFSRVEMEELLAMPDTMPPYMRLFVEDTRKEWGSLSEKELINRATTFFIDWTSAIDNAFLREWLHFQYNLKNLLIWLNSHKFSLDPRHEVLGNHFEAVYLRETRKDEIDLKSWDFRYREVMTHFDNPNIAIREAVIDEMRWQYLTELEEHYTFGIERLLAFAIRLQIINRNITTTERQGLEHLLLLLENIREGYEMPEEFNIENIASSRRQTIAEMMEETAENV